MPPVFGSVLHSGIAAEAGAPRGEVGERTGEGKIIKKNQDINTTQLGCLRPSLLSSVSFLSLCFFLHSLEALRLRSLRFHSPRLCRVAVFLIQTNVSLSLGLFVRGVCDNMAKETLDSVCAAGRAFPFHRGLALVGLCREIPEEFRNS